MHVMDSIQARRSIRKYQDRPVEPEKLDAVLEAIRLAPSARNLQPWEFYVVTKESACYDAVVEAANHQPSTESAPIILVGCGKRNRLMTNGHYSDSINVSIAMSFAMLEAVEQGLGTCWLAAYDPQKMQQALGLAADMLPVVVMPLGYADEAPDARPRNAKEEIIHTV